MLNPDTHHRMLSAVLVFSACISILSLSKAAHCEETDDAVEIVLEDDHRDAQFAAGRAYAIGEDVPVDLEKAVEYLTLAAEQGHSEAMISLGTLFDSEVEPVYKPNDSLAFEWYKKAASRGDTNAQYLVAMRLEDGRGTDVNMDEALVWLRSSARMGNAESQARLGFYFTRGRYMQLDYAKARYWYQKAA